MNIQELANSYTNHLKLLNDNNFHIDAEVLDNMNIVIIGDYEFHDIGFIGASTNRRNLFETVKLAIKFYEDIVSYKSPVGPFFGESGYSIIAYYRPR
ncbi:hypothetical protein FDH34_gp408 [Serratia phage BF]|uniref:Uncharacterized protein n=1 Tax=Serratia phage BF TaxID=1962671 RepID=A0A1S6UBG7_9CAUD|nr:hypothetical protein FDH34_gp408 [Serratia phage BF]AQW89037.1 hypothetical protein BF_0512 [Serratia phage BF]